MLDFKSTGGGGDVNSPEQGELFYSLIKLIKAKTIVEIGVDWGSTSRYLCAAAVATGGKLYGYDCWGDHGPNKAWHHGCSAEKVTEMLKKNGFTEDNFLMTKVETLEPGFKELIHDRHSESKIDFAFIDADHSYDGLKSDFEAVYPYMSNTGIIAFHDTLRIDGCREFVIDWRNNNDGTYDIVEFPFGNLQRRVGITLLVKRTYPVLGLGCDEHCGSPSSFDEIYKKEQIWLTKQLRESRQESPGF
jgi:predicted O-methyltransferase YrrM